MFSYTILSYYIIMLIYIKIIILIMILYTVIQDYLTDLSSTTY